MLIVAFNSLSLIKEHNELQRTNYSDKAPDLAPSDPILYDIWMQALTRTPANQGCGHVKLMMSYPEDYGLVDQEALTPSWLMEAFFSYWWRSPPGSLERSKILFLILPGDLEGRSMTLINNTGPNCLGETPAFIPHHAASTQFVYAPQAVSDFRRLVLAPFFMAYDKSVNGPALYETISKMQDIQLGATLRLLYPVNTLPLNQVDITTTTATITKSAISSGRKMLHLHSHSHLHSHDHDHD